MVARPRGRCDNFSERARDDNHPSRHGQRAPHRLGNGGAVIFMSEKKICAITGSNGYVGGCAKNYFTARGWEILELTRRPKPGMHGIRFQLGAEISPSSLAGADALVHCA